MGTTEEKVAALEAATGSQQAAAEAARVARNEFAHAKARALRAKAAMIEADLVEVLAEERRDDLLGELKAAIGGSFAEAVKRMLSGEPTPGCECARCVAVRDTKGRAQC